MFIISNSPRAETLHSTALVAFNPATGRVYGTFVHSSYEVNDRAGVARSREHFLKDLAARSEQKTALLSWHNGHMTKSERPMSGEISPIFC